MAKAITSEHGLYLESKTMHHCVVQYGPSCAKGDTRIFSLLKDGQHLATGEISKNGNSWHSTQTKTFRNHLASQAAQQAMQETAEAYTQAWSQSNRGQSQSWTEIFEPGLLSPEAAAATD